MSTTRVKTIASALTEFLLAPSSKGMSNEELIVETLGVKGIHMVDPPTFDAVSMRYEKAVSTFEEAFYACWHGLRDWARFDLTTLRECANLGGLQLPPRIAAIIDARFEDEERAAIVAEASEAEDAWIFHEEEPALPPVELLERAPEPAPPAAPAREPAPVSSLRGRALVNAVREVMAMPDYDDLQKRLVSIVALRGRR